MKTYPVTDKGKAYSVARAGFYDWLRAEGWTEADIAAHEKNLSLALAYGFAMGHEAAVDKVAKGGGE